MFDTIEKKVFLVLSLCLFIFDATFVYINYKQDELAFQNDLDEESRRLKSTFDVAFSLTLSNMSQIASYVANDPHVQKTFAEASIAFNKEGRGKGGPQSARLRYNLYDEVSNSWEYMRDKFSVRQLHFHLPPKDTSFLRVHKLDKWGDDLSAIRHLIVDTMEDQQPREGYELGRVYAGIRAVTPVFAPQSKEWNGQFIGALEAGTSFKEIIQNLKSQIGSEVAILMNRERVTSAKWNNVHDRNYETTCDCFIEASSMEKMPDWFSKLNLNKIRKENPLELSSEIIKSAGNTYSITHFGFKDYIGLRDNHERPVGRVIMWSDATDEVISLKNNLYVNIVYAIFAFIFFEFLLFYAIRFVHKKFKDQLEIKTAEVISLNILAKENEDRLKIAGLVAYDLIYEWDVKTDSLIWYGDVDRLLGFRDGEISDDIHTWLNLIHPNDVSKLQNAVEQHRNDTSPIEYEYRIKHNDGSYRFWSDNAHPFLGEDGKPYKWVGVCADITERRIAENDLARFFEQPMNIHLIADLDGKILRLNKGWQVVLGYPIDELLGCSFFDLIHPDDIPSTFAEMEKLANGQRTFYFENRYKHKDETYRLLAWSAVAVFEDNKVYAVASDITVRKSYEEELKRSKKTAESANIVKSEFLANMSHELRTPMTGIRGVLDLLKSNDAVVKEAGDLLIDLDLSSHALSTLLNDILDLSKIEAGKLFIEKIPCDLSHVLENVIHIFTPIANEKGLIIHSNIRDISGKWFEIDGLRIRQIASNLLNNAVKFTYDGSVSVDVWTEQKDEALALHFSVSDTGIGMSQTQQERIFKRFSQADQSTTRKFGGSGLGLSISKELAFLMDGKLNVVSNEGQGTKFELQMPIKRVEPIEEILVDETKVPSLKILLAEDNKINQRVAKIMLEKMGHVVTTVVNGIEAVEVAKKQAFSVILMDMQMPEMGGEEATHIIRNLNHPNSQIPIFAFTADAVREHKERYLKSGVNDIVVKPIKWDELNQKLMTHLNLN